MELIIRNTNNQPIYEQICTQIKAQIISGKLAPGEALPSIRALAKDLRVSVITTKRAYDELEADGFLYTVAGKGCFVAEKNLDLTLPLMFRFGTERGRLLMFFIIFLVCGSAGAVAGIAPDLNGNAYFALTLSAAALAAVVLTVLSVPFSIRLYRRKRR